MNLASIRNILFNWMGMAANILYGFFLVPIVIRGLGDAHYGLWNLVMSCVGYMAVLDFGIQTAVNRYVAKYRGIDDVDGVNSVYTNAIVMYSFIAAAALVIGAAIALNAGRIFNVSPSDALLVRDVMLLMTLFAAIELPCNVFGAVLYAYQRFDILNGISISMLCLQALFVWLAMHNGVGLWGYSVILFGLGVLKYIIQYFACHRVAGALKFRIPLISRATVRTMVTFSGITFLSIIVNYIIFKTDNIVIGLFLSPEAITFYSIGFMLSDYVAQIVTKMCSTFTPMFSEYEAKGQHEPFKQLLLNSSRFSSLIGVPAGLVVMALGRDFIRLWLGTGYEEAFVVMVILMASRMVGFPTAAMSSMLYGIGRHYINLYTGVFEAVANIVLSVILVKLYGIKGVAIGTLVPMVLANIFYPVMVCRNMGINFWSWMLEAVIKPGIISAVFFGIVLMIPRSCSTPSWAGLLGDIVVIGIVFIALFWFVGLKTEERALILARIRLVRATG
ncbi:MAG TPA: oligosaccharide flippase family protein [Deltaproteobacteria bacterium]|nr:oligosaccharide flippase family protein [Deltaproteobacteria bacterium]